LSGLTEEDLESVQAEFPAFDFPAVYQKFVAYHTKKGTQQATKEMLVGWFKREKPQKDSRTSGKVKTAAGAKNASTGTRERKKAESYIPVEGRLAAANLGDIEDSELGDLSYLTKVDWRIGNRKADEDKMYLLLTMTKRTRKEAGAYFVEVMGKGVSCGETYLIFDEDRDGNLEGVLLQHWRDEAERKAKKEAERLNAERQRQRDAH
jgi:hypothetical protein